MVQDKKTKEILGFYPHFALISFTNNTRKPVDTYKNYILTPVKHVVRTTNMSVTYNAHPKNDKWQKRVWRYAENKYDQRVYLNSDNANFWYKSADLPLSKDYVELPEKPRYHWHRYQRRHAHTAWGWRHIRNYNRLSNFKYNQYQSYPKMRHRDRHLQDEFDFEHWRSGFSTGWKNKKIKHQYMVHWRQKRGNLLRT